MDFVHDKRVNSLGIIDVLQTTQIRIQKVSTTEKSKSLHYRHGKHSNSSRLHWLFNIRHNFVQRLKMAIGYASAHSVICIILDACLVVFSTNP
jgi:hypothetical protein